MMAWRRLSSGVARRFPTYGHFIAVSHRSLQPSSPTLQAGLLTERELGHLEALSAQTEEGNRQVTDGPQATSTLSFRSPGPPSCGRRPPSGEPAKTNS